MADFRLKYTKFAVGCGSAPDPAGGAYSAPQTPYLDLKGPTSKERGKEEGKERREEGEGRGRGREGREETRHSQEKFCLRDWIGTKIDDLG